MSTGSLLPLLATGAGLGVGLGLGLLWSSRKPADQRKTYHSNGNLHTIYTLRDNRIDGEYRSYHENGMIHVVAQYRDGKREGSYESWSATGLREVSSTYKEDLLEGNHQEWSQGVLLIQCRYSGGLLHGMHRKWDNGIPTDTPYKLGKRNGPSTRYFDSASTKKAMTFTEDDEGRLQGPCTKWDASGNVTVKCNYLDGELDGTHVAFHRDGTRTEAEYRAGRLHGPHTTFSPIASKLKCGIYRDGVPVGVHTEWSAGEIIREVTYMDGAVVETRNVSRMVTGPSRSETKTYKGPDGKVTTLWSYYYSEDALAEVRELRSPGDDYKNVSRVLALNDRQGRDCCLKEGEITVWKVAKARGLSAVETQTVVDEDGAERITTVKHTPWVPVYIRLTVPAEAKRVTPLDSDYKYKSRVEFARVDQIVDKEGNEYKEARSSVNPLGKVTVYTLGEVARPDGFNPDPSVECGAGLHVHAFQDHCDVWMDRWM